MYTIYYFYTSFNIQLIAICYLLRLRVTVASQLLLSPLQKQDLPPEILNKRSNHLTTIWNTYVMIIVSTSSRRTFSVVLGADLVWDQPMSGFCLFLYGCGSSVNLALGE